MLFNVAMEVGGRNVDPMRTTLSIRDRNGGKIFTEAWSFCLGAASLRLGLGLTG